MIYDANEYKYRIKVFSTASIFRYVREIIKVVKKCIRLNLTVLQIR